MKKGPSFRIAAVTIIFTHLFMVCFRDISFAGPEPISKDASSDSIDFERLGRVPDTVGHGSKQLPSPKQDHLPGDKSSSDTIFPELSFKRTPLLPAMDLIGYWNRYPRIYSPAALN